MHFTATTKYRPEIDGLRALAIVPVILFMLELQGLAVVTSVSMCSLLSVVI